MPKHLFDHRSSSGFTLIEMLVVVVIIGTIGAIALPSWLAFVNVRRLNTAQDQVYQAIRQAQSNAKRDKITWQASFREVNGVVQWTVHPADAKIFLTNAVSANDNLWHDLNSNIRIDKSRNNKGKYETSFNKDSVTGAWRVLFNYQGCPVYKPGDECTQTVIKALGRIAVYSKNGGKARRCVILSTLLGAMRTGKEHTKADETDKYCY